MRWRALACVCYLVAVGIQGLRAEEPRRNRAAKQWVQAENRKCPKQVRQWFEIADKENLFDEEPPASAMVKVEGIEDGVNWYGREPLPSPPSGYQVEHLRRIRLAENECCLASYMKEGKYPLGLSTIYLWQGHQWSKLLQNEGTIDNIEGIEFIRISPDYDPLVVVTNFGGGSGIGRTLYSVSRKGRVRRLLNIGNWNEGGYSLWDFDGDGVFELVHRTRVFHPASLKARLSKGGDYDLVTPILYKDTIYRWKGNRFEASGSRYWVDE